MFRRVAWHRVRQGAMEKLMEGDNNELTKVLQMGLRAFLPKLELMNRVSSFADLKGNVGRRMFVCIIRFDEATNDLIISERKAWEMMHLKEGTLLDGTIRKIFPFGAQVGIGETNICGLLHISNITQGRITSVEDVLEVDLKGESLGNQAYVSKKNNLKHCRSGKRAGSISF
ncbi:hypothetical protein HPP92_022641 [Vanilla planifolia]|uniref:S1 motif domain-containing protein n=1 Tax=Vanilla planifolia TaxID=51239 RepID=A0A835PYN3_VANPL|nr:hypothetical protein HPP92_022641 [Vanilla planifolia]